MSNPEKRDFVKGDRAQQGIGLVGSGYMARKHCAALASEPGVSFAALCSTGRSQPSARELAQKYGFSQCTTKITELVENPEVDLVYICTPDDTHADLAVAGLSAGKHVFCEKPLARSKAEFQKIGNALKKSGRILQVGMNCRFREQYSKARERIASGELGRLRFIRGTYCYNMVRSLRSGEKTWSWAKDKDCDTFLHGGGIHCLDLMRWIGGEVKSVFARGTGYELGAEYNHDTFSVSLEFAGGALGELTVSASAFRPNEFSLEMWLERGSIVGTNVHLRQGNALSGEGQQIVVEQKVLDLRLQYREFLQAISRNTQPMNGFASALRNFNVLSAIEESVRHQTVIATADI